MANNYLVASDPTLSTQNLQVPSANDISAGTIYTVGNSFRVDGADIANYITFLNTTAPRIYPFSVKQLYQHIFASTGVFSDQLNDAWTDICNAYLTIPNNNGLCPIFDASLNPSKQQGIWLYMNNTTPHPTATIPNVSQYPQGLTFPLFGPNNLNTGVILSTSNLQIISNESNVTNTTSLLGRSSCTPGYIVVASQAEITDVQTVNGGANGTTLGTIFPSSNAVTPYLVSLTALSTAMPTDTLASIISNDYNLQRTQVLLSTANALVHGTTGYGNVRTTISVTSPTNLTSSFIKGYMTPEQVRGMSLVCPNGNINGIITGNIIYTANINGITYDYTPAGYVAALETGAAGTSGISGGTEEGSIPTWAIWVIVAVVVLIIGGIVWYFIYRNNKKKKEAADQDARNRSRARQQAIIRQKMTATKAAPTVVNAPSPSQPNIIIQQPAAPVVQPTYVPPQPTYAPPPPQPTYFSPPQQAYFPPQRPVIYSNPPYGGSSFEQPYTSYALVPS
jgi:hypothetical protein